MDGALTGDPPPPGKALATLAAVAVIIAGFVALTALLGNGEAWAGFLFLLCWSLGEGMRPERLPRTVAGALLGIGLASLLFLLPAAAGPTAGGLAFLAALLVLVYLQIRGHAPMLINMTTMIFLTVGTVPHVQEHARFGEVLVALLLGVGYFGGLAAAAALVGQRRAAARQAR